MVGVDLFKRSMASIALIAAVLGLGGCEAGSEPLVWKAQQLAFVVDHGRGALQVLSVRSGVSLLKIIDLGPLEDAPAMLVDESRAVLWVRGDAQLMRFDLPSLRGSGRWPLPEEARGASLEASPSGALTLHAGGKAFVIENRFVAELVAPRAPS